MNIKEFKIEDRVIHPDKPPFIIAEVGINHEGNIQKALEMVDAAKEAGADCVKFQSHIVDKEMIKTNITPKNAKEPLWDIIERCQLSEEEEFKVKNYCDKKGIMYMCTPFSREASDRLEGMGVRSYKIGSGECNNLPLLKHIAKKGKPIILSTGMNDLKSVERSIKIFEKYKCSYMLMHCTSMYPTPYDKVRLAAIPQLIEYFKVPVGLSDHSYGIYTCLGAVALDASALEKHFTITRDWPGPDIPISMEPQELAELVKGSRAIWQARDGEKNILSEEQPVIDFAYASVVTIKPVKRGEVLSENNIWVKRPGTGKILATEWDKVMGKTAAKDLAVNVQLDPQDIENWE